MQLNISRGTLRKLPKVCKIFGFFYPPLSAFGSYLYNKIHATSLTTSAFARTPLRSGHRIWKLPYFSVYVEATQQGAICTRLGRQLRERNNCSLGIEGKIMAGNDVLLKLTRKIILRGRLVHAPTKYSVYFLPAGERAAADVPAASSSSSCSSHAGYQSRRRTDLRLHPSKDQEREGEGERDDAK